MWHEHRFLTNCDGRTQSKTPNPTILVTFLLRLLHALYINPGVLIGYNILHLLPLMQHSCELLRCGHFGRQW